MEKFIFKYFEELGYFCYIDFEFNCTNHEKINLVSCVTYDLKTKEVKKFWLHNNQKEKSRLSKHLVNYDVIIGYACVAEARSFYSLGLNPLNFKWIDLFLEYRMLTNHNDKLNWGKQLVDGKVKFVTKPKPKYERTEEDSLTGFKPTHSLAEATYKLTGQIRNTVEKDECRDLIISNPPSFTNEQKERILAYNEEDVVFLSQIFDSILKEFDELVHEADWSEYFKEAMWRGRYSAHTAIMESFGYPINYEATKNFSSKIPSILAECQSDINSQFKKDFYPFKWNAKDCTYSWNQKAAREWIVKQDLEYYWTRTDRTPKHPEGQLSLKLEAWEKHFQFKHDYPEGNFGAQMLRYLKLKQSLNGFSIRPGKKNFWDSVGPDKRVRPYMNIYGAQSSRSQPAATGFMFLKPAWMRALVEPSKGFYLAAIDYGQQEFFIAALLSGDENMITAYLSGDPYLYMAKQAGLIPKDGTKKTHGRERDLMKSTTLGILFSMTKYGLSKKLTADSGREYTEEEAQELIDTFEDLFPVFTDWRREVLMDYEDGYPIKLKDGWVMWGDNDNPRSVTNVPIQGLAACIMRKAVDIAVSLGCKVIFTLHDAIYIEAPMNKFEDITHLHTAMRDGFSHYFEDSNYYSSSRRIKLDPKAWGPDFIEKGEIKVNNIEIPVSKIHIDPRAIPDYERFSKYFSKPDTDLL